MVSKYEFREADPRGSSAGSKFEEGKKSGRICERRGHKKKKVRDDERLKNRRTDKL